MFLQINRNKLGMTLDPMRPEGQEVVRKLVATRRRGDRQPAAADRCCAMKLDYESLKAVKPDIILTTVSAYGRGGPYSDRVGFDGIGQVMSGAVYMTGEPRISPIARKCLGSISARLCTARSAPWRR